MPFTAGSDIEDMMRYVMKHLKNVLQKRDLWVYMETISNNKISSILSFQIFFRKRPHPHLPPPKKN